jgi:hypothetical protein
VTPFNLEETYRPFGGNYKTRLQIRKVVVRKISTCMHGVAFQKVGIFMITTV